MGQRVKPEEVGVGSCETAPGCGAAVGPGGLPPVWLQLASSCDDKLGSPYLYSMRLTEWTVTAWGYAWVTDGTTTTPYSSSQRTYYSTAQRRRSNHSASRPTCMSAASQLGLLATMDGRGHGGRSREGGLRDMAFITGCQAVRHPATLRGWAGQIPGDSVYPISDQRSCMRHTTSLSGLASLPSPPHCRRETGVDADGA